ncbi:1,4-dihydroxy-2-naphthoate polyprenyltransferase [bacterium]|nr:MAG: 1,4-dihydroxy-2-naphthoate polyprenyltransferase [bacterium]
MATFSDWLDATRPKTLPAAVIPVALASVLAYTHGSLKWDVFGVALWCALLIQIASNLANDYFDHKKGADTEERVGFKRASASGAIAPKTVLRATIFVLTLAFICGLYLVWMGGWIILTIGLSSLLFAVLYTGGPFPLAYNGLGDLFVFIYFGIVSVTGTYFLHTGVWNWETFWISLVPAALCTNILVVNNLRDTETDKKANKRTLGVLFGDNFLRLEYLLMLGIAFGIPPHLWFWNNYSLWIFLPFLSAPIALFLAYKVVTIKDKSLLNNQLAKTAQYLVIFGILLSIGIGLQV